jgi:hypothetical protein
MTRLFLVSAMLVGAAAGSLSTAFAQTSYSRYGGNVYGSDGSHYSVFGDTVFDDHGNSMGTLPDKSYGSDGSSYSHGNSVYDDQWNSSSTFGNYGTNGRHCSTFGNTAYCD